MGSQPVVFNHVGLCVRDRAASRRFYEGLLGFEFWWELDAPDEGTDVLLQWSGQSGCMRRIWCGMGWCWSCWITRSGRSMLGGSG